MENTLFVNIGNMGMGDYLFCVCLSIYLKNKYENIYVHYSAVHFNSMMYLLNRLFEENNATNIKCIGNKIYKDKNCSPPSSNFIYSDEISSDINDKFHIYKQEIEVDEYKNVYIYLNNICNKKINSFDLTFYYDIVLNYYNINIYTIKNCIQFKLNSYEETENNNIYEKFVKSIDNEKYILVFHSIERNQYNFAFRDYPNDFNKNKYKIINVCKRYNDLTINKNNEYYLNELIHYFPPMYNLHKIIENAQEIHLMDSYPLHYFNFMFKNINNSKVYSRMVTGIYLKDNISNKNKNIFNNEYIQIFNININGLHETYYPINYIKKLYADTNLDINMLLLFYNYLNVETMDNIDLHEHFINFEKIINNEKYFLYKVLPLTSCNSNIGIFTKTLSNDINFIEVNLSEKKLVENINDIIYTSIDKVIHEIDSLNNKSLNILLVKTEGDYILKIKPFNETIHDLDTNYENIQKSLFDIVEYYLHNKNIHYIYPYGDDEDKNNFTDKLIHYSYKVFSNKISTTYKVYKA